MVLAVGVEVGRLIDMVGMAVFVLGLLVVAVGEEGLLAFVLAIEWD